MYIITNGLIDTDYGVKVGEESGCFVSGSFSIAQFCNSVACVHTMQEGDKGCLHCEQLQSFIASEQSTGVH